MQARKPSEHSEHVLIEEMRNGNPGAFADFVRIHSPRMYQTSLKILRNHADAEDNVQNALWKAYKSIGRFEARSRFSTWLVRITVNEALMRIRERRPEYLVLDAAKPEGEESITLEASDGRPDPERQYIAKELLIKAFWGLPSSLGDIFVRNKAEGWTQRELAREMGITISGIKSRIFQARKRLREQLGCV